MNIEVTEEQARLLKALLCTKVYPAWKAPTDGLSASARYVADQLKPVYEQLRNLPVKSL